MKKLITILLTILVIAGNAQIRKTTSFEINDPEPDYSKHKVWILKYNETKILFNDYHGRSGDNYYFELTDKSEIIKECLIRNVKIILETNKGYYLYNKDWHRWKEIDQRKYIRIRNRRR